MAVFTFEKGSEVVIKLNEKILGGVYRAVCEIENTFTDIGSFLEAKPVCRIPETTRRIVLETDFQNADVFEEKTSFEIISFTTKNKIIVFEGCTIESVDITVLPNDKIKYVIKISAEESRIYDRE